MACNLKNQLGRCASLLASVVAAITLASIAHAAKTPPGLSTSGQEQRDWPTYGGAPENNHYSGLAQINRNNVKRLAVAWSFDTQEEGGLQSSPIIVDGILYGITPTQKVFALDAATGKLLWKFDSGIRGTQPDRGLAYWADGKDKRILVGVMNFVYGTSLRSIYCRDQSRRCLQRSIDCRRPQPRDSPCATRRRSRV